MPISPGNTIRVNHYINESERNATPANDEGKVVKLESDGLISNTFLRNKFGGDGSDGALDVSSGTTNIDLGGARVFIKNYSSISITGTGAITFSNPATEGTTIIFKCKGDAVMTSSANPLIDLRLLGSTGGTASDGSNGTAVRGLFGEITSAEGGKVTGPTIGSRAPLNGINKTSLVDFINSNRVIPVDPSSGGGGAVNGKGGRGGGGFLLECAGALNFTGVINGAGEAGDGNGNNRAGGGGAGSLVFLIYNILTANTGTITITAGSGGSGQNVGDWSGGAGGGTLFNNGNNRSAGNGSGALGAIGFGLVMQNKVFF